MQMSRRLRLVHHEDVLDDSSQIPGDRLRAKRTLRRRRGGGGSASHAFPATLFPAAQAVSWVHQAHGHGLGVLGAFPQLLRGGHRHGKRRDAGTALQPHVASRGRLQPHVLRPRPQHPPVHARVAVQLQVPVVLFCQVQHLQRKDRGFHLQMKQETTSQWR